MANRLNKIVFEIKDLKRELANLWEKRQRTDGDVLKLSIRIDRLLNEHGRLLRGLDDDGPRPLD